MNRLFEIPLVRRTLIGTWLLATLFFTLSGILYLFLPTLGFGFRLTWLDALVPFQEVLVFAVALLASIQGLVIAAYWAGQPRFSCRVFLPLLLTLGLFFMVGCNLLMTFGLGRQALTQASLAQQLGVRIMDYPSPERFPFGYYEETLEPGTPMEKVHSQVEGYAEVEHCGGWTEAKVAERERYVFRGGLGVLVIAYDNQGRLLHLGQEDESAPLRGCEPGPANEEEYR